MATFQQARAGLATELDAIEESVHLKDWHAASKRLAKVEPNLVPLFGSSIKAQPEVMALEKRYGALKESLRAAARDTVDAREREGAATAAVERRASQRRLILEDRKWDDGARGLVFKGALRTAGQRCDDVTRMTMREAGSWTVTCAPGYAYRFRFDATGKLASAQRVD